MPDELHDRLEKLKEKIGLSKTSLINAAVEEYIRTRSQSELEKRIAQLEKEVAELKKEKKKPE